MCVESNVIEMRLSSGWRLRPRADPARTDSLSTVPARARSPGHREGRGASTGMRSWATASDGRRTSRTWEALRASPRAMSRVRTRAGVPGAGRRRRTSAVAELRQAIRMRMRRSFGHARMSVMPGIRSRFADPRGIGGRSSVDAAPSGAPRVDGRVSWMCAGVGVCSRLLSARGSDPARRGVSRVRRGSCSRSA